MTLPLSAVAICPRDQGRHSRCRYGPQAASRPESETDAMRVHLPPDGKLLQIESGDAHLLAEVAAWLTSPPGFPAYSRIAMFDWANVGVPLRPGTTAADLLAAHRCPLSGSPAAAAKRPADFREAGSGEEGPGRPGLPARDQGDVLDGPDRGGQVGRWSGARLLCVARNVRGHSGRQSPQLPCGKRVAPPPPLGGEGAISAGQTLRGAAMSGNRQTSWYSSDCGGGRADLRNPR